MQAWSGMHLPCLGIRNGVLCCHTCMTHVLQFPSSLPKWGRWAGEGTPPKKLKRQNLLLTCSHAYFARRNWCMDYKYGRHETEQSSIHKATGREQRLQQGEPPAIGKLNTASAWESQEPLEAGDTSKNLKDTPGDLCTCTRGKSTSGNFQVGQTLWELKSMHGFP